MMPIWFARLRQMPCNTSGFFDPMIAGQYGVADFDWSNAREMVRPAGLACI